MWIQLTSKGILAREVVKTSINHIKQCRSPHALTTPIRITDSVPRINIQYIQAGYNTNPNICCSQLKNKNGNQQNNDYGRKIYNISTQTTSAKKFFNPLTL